MRSKFDLYGIDVNPTKLDYVTVEVSYGSRWVDINDQDKYVLSAEGTRDQTAKSWRKITSTSPVLGGTYLIHAVPEMVSETVGVWVRGSDQVTLNENLTLLETLFTQFEYRIRWTLNEYRETWRCQLADAAISRNHVWTHNHMAAAQFTVPRWPDIETEIIE